MKFCHKRLKKGTLKKDSYRWEARGTHENKAPQRRWISTTSTPLSLGNAKSRIL